MDSVCGGTLTRAANPNGTIESPGFSENSTYDSSVQCIWKLSNHQSANSSISIRFITLNLEHHGDCNWDFVQFREGS